MNSRERFLVALDGGKPDRTPLAHVSALTTIELQESTGCFMPEVHQDPQSLVRLCGANADVLGFDAVSFIINYFGEPAALGCEINWGAKDALPVYTSHPWATPEDAVCPPDILDRPAIRNYLEVLKIARQRYPQVAVLGKVMGPFSMAMVMHGLENVMMAMMDEPAKVTHFVRVAMDVLVRCANAQFEAGADAVAIGEGGAGANMLSPQMYEELLMPLHQEMIRRINGPTIMHICGDITPRLASLRRIGLKCFNFDWAIRPATMKASSQGFALMGNVNTGDLLMGKPADIRGQVFENLDAGVDIISPGCAVSPKCPNRNLQAMADAIKEWHAKGKEQS
jgi:[methyl-Co(III) methanol-specific corrinoid protein]:coenzyme M methyltransferase